MIVTTSWDDGHPADLRLADLLRKHGIRGTFYVPTKNREGRPVVRPPELRAISRDFEIGGHTRDHVVLTSLAAESVTSQVVEGKRYLEDETGQSINSFCYPRGKVNHLVRQCVQDAGFRLGRTTANFYVDPSSQEFDMPVTLQIFSHSSRVYLKNLIKYGSMIERLPILIHSLRGRSIVEKCERIVDWAVHEKNCVLHFWGHSWEIDECGLWEDVETVLKILNCIKDIQYMTNFEAKCLSQVTRAR